MINFLKQAAWTSVITNTASIITFLGTIILARFISPETFGIYVFCFAVKEIISCLCAPSLSQTYLFSNGTKNDFTKVLYINLFFSIFILIGTFIVGYLIFLKYSSQYFYIILIFGLLSILNNFSSIFLAIGEKQMDFKRTSLIRSSALIISLVFTCIFALILGDKVLVLVLKEILFSVILISSSSLFYLKKRNSNEKKVKRKSFSLLRYSLRSYFPKVTEILSYKIFEILTADILGKSILGLFYQGLNLVRVPYRFLGSITDNILFVHLKEIDKGQKLDDFSSIQNLILLVVIPIVLTFNLFNYEIVNIILGKKWLEISEVLGLLSIFLLILPFYNSLITVYQASDNQRHYTTTNVLVLVFQIIGILILPKNISGFIFAYCSSFLIGTIYLTLFITKNDGFFNSNKIINILYLIILIFLLNSFYHIYNMSIMLFLIFFLWIFLIYMNKNMIVLIIKKWKN